LLNNSASKPNSVSVETSGRRFLLPRMSADSVPPVPIKNVSYCAVVFGRLPAWPHEARNFMSFTAFEIGFQNASSDARHANEARP